MTILQGVAGKIMIFLFADERTRRGMPRGMCSELRSRHGCGYAASASPRAARRCSAAPRRDMYVTFQRWKVTKDRSGKGRRDLPFPDTFFLLAVQTHQLARSAARGGICKDLFVKTLPFTARPTGSISSPRPDDVSRMGEDRPPFVCERFPFHTSADERTVIAPMSAAERANHAPHVSR